MTAKSSASPKSPAAQLIRRRIHELQGRKSQAEIAAEAGFKSPNMLSMIKDGKVKLPIERAVSLAKALECDPMKLVRMVLDETLSKPLVDQIFAAAPGTRTSDGREPEVERVSSSPPLAGVLIALLGIEVRAARRELAQGKTLMKSAIVRSERIERRLQTLGAELELMAKEGAGYGA